MPIVLPLHALLRSWCRCRRGRRPRREDRPGSVSRFVRGRTARAWCRATVLTSGQVNGAVQRTIAVDCAVVGTDHRSCPVGASTAGLTRARPPAHSRPRRKPASRLPRNAMAAWAMGRTCWVTRPGQGQDHGRAWPRRTGPIPHQDRQPTDGRASDAASPKREVCGPARLPTSAPHGCTPSNHPASWYGLRPGQRQPRRRPHATRCASRRPERSPAGAAPRRLVRRRGGA